MRPSDSQLAGFDFCGFCIPLRTISGYTAAMSYVTLEVEIDHGRVVSKGPDPLPDKAAGLLTILPPGVTTTGGITPLDAFKELQRRLQLTPEKAESWKATIRDSRR